MKNIILLALLSLLSLPGLADAGWYHVENYEGTLGNQPVTLSLQTYDSFGSGITVEGSFIAGDSRSPVALYGTVDGTVMRLCSIGDEAEFQRVMVQGSAAPVNTSACPISLKIDNRGAAGTWKDGSGEKVLKLQRIASLDDTGEPRVEGSVIIPFWAQTSTQMLAGSYAVDENGLCLRTLSIVNKSSGKADQTIPFTDDICNAGMVMTPIYMNVEHWVDGTTAILSVNVRDSGAGHSQDFVWDATTRLWVEQK